MSLKKSLLILVLFIIAFPIFAQEIAADLKKVIAVQQATITQLNKNLAAAATLAAAANRVADEALNKANAAAAVAANAQTSASNADTKAGRLFTSNSGGGGRSCRTQCAAVSASCVVAFAGDSPAFETWACNANPAGNLLCLCVQP